MGEVALRRIQSAIEVTRGTPLAATRKVYGTCVVTKMWPRRYAVEDRGNFTDKFRANRKLNESGATVVMDATFEDTPWIMAHVLRGAVTPTGTATTGYTWTYAPDTTSDLLSTSTVEAGDDTVAMQGSFFTVDTADFVMPLDDALSASLGAFVADWLPQNSSDTPSSFAGFTGSLAERTVESAVGWQQRLYIDPTGAAVGTTQVVGRFKTAAFAIHNQNKRKYFGDAGVVFTKLGRGRRQVSGTITLEAVDTHQYALFANNTSQAIRLQLIGSAITGTTLGTTTAAAINPGTISSIPCLALAAAIPGGIGISISGVAFAVTAAGAAINATAIPVVPQTLTQTIPISQTILAARTMNFDFWGVLETWTYGNVDTNTTYAFGFQAMYDATAAKEINVTVLNGVSTMA